MQTQTTRQAFQLLLDTPAMQQAAGLDRNAVYLYRHRFKHNKITVELMESTLKAAGFVIRQETTWLTPEQYKELLSKHA